MKIKPLEYDKTADFSLVELKEDYPGRITPHCKKHGAMNKLNDIWRCLSEYSRDEPKEGETIGVFRDRVCNACCVDSGKLGEKDGN